MGSLVKKIRLYQGLLLAFVSVTILVSGYYFASDLNQITVSANEITKASSPLPQEVYIWQRQWRDANQTALKQSQEAFQGLRILALQAHPKPNGGDIWFEVAVNHTWLQADPRPKIIVVRLDGQLKYLNNNEVINKINKLLTDWQTKGTHIIGLEIDHDSASSKLVTYQKFLQRLKKEIPTNIKLSITALPAWLNSPNFPPLLNLIDELVLQIHSVSDPRLGLFDANQGWQWVEQLASISTVPYLVALPSYGSAVFNTPSGYRVESEVPLLQSSPKAMQELMADPEVLQAFVSKLETKKLPKLRGIIWFRLPLEGDQRIWPLSTLIAVVKREKLVSNIELQILSEPKSAQIHSAQSTSTDQTILFKLVLVNKGNIAGKLPNYLSLAAQTCRSYDAQNGYRATLKQGKLDWLLQQETIEETPKISTTMLSPNGRKVIGWARCESLQLREVYAP